MSDTVSRSASKNSRPLTDSKITVYLYMGLIFLGLLGLWEGLKFLGDATDYQLDLGFTTISLKLTQDVNLPHLSQIGEALSEPAQRNGSPLIQVLTEAALFTAQEAILGFTMGTLFGLTLAIVFVYSGFLQRGLMPFVVASQTVPILAIAPMVVIWTASIDLKLPFDPQVIEQVQNLRPLGVPLIAAYLAFFPVTIYALRGLADVPQTALELMESYAASQWQILWKLRIPNAIPYIFTALKITAPASVVGAVIGELPAGIQEGLGGAILNYAQYYTSNPPQLWATNLITALVGILFFSVVAITEKLLVRWKPEDLV